MLMRSSRRSSGARKFLRSRAWRRARRAPADRRRSVGRERALAQILAAEAVQKRQGVQEPLVLREHSDRDALHGVAGKPDRLPHLGREPPQEALQQEHLPLAPVARHVAAEQFIGRLAREEDLDTLLARELGDQQKRDRVGMGERRIAVVGARARLARKSSAFIGWIRRSRPSASVARLA